MRSRPKVTMHYAARVATPGEPFQVEVLVASKTETPVDFIETSLHGVEQVRIGDGKAEQRHRYPLVALAVQETPKVLAPGEHRYAYTFDVPRDLPPSYRGNRGSVEYRLSVHVSIPWWPDRKAHFTLPLAPRGPTPSPTGTPRLAASSNGPQAGQVYLEVSIDSDVVFPGGTLSGAVSVSNTGAHRVRRVVITLVGREVVFAPQSAVASADWLSKVVVDGAPEEGVAVPFTLDIPRGTPPTFTGSAFRLEFSLQARADVAFGADAVTLIPLVVLRPSLAPAAKDAAPRATGRYYPVGRDRFALVWAAVAKQLGMELEGDGRTLRASAGEASLVVRGEDDGKAHRLVVELGWPSLGIDLHIGTRGWSDLVGGWPGPSEKGRARLVIRGREPEQLAALLDAETLDVLACYTTVAMDDDRARLTLAAPGTNAPELAQACRSALGLLGRIATWGGGAGVEAKVPPPRSMAGALRAWRAFAARTSATVEVGSMSLRRGAIGGEAFAIETCWGGTDEVLTTLVSFPFEPPLDSEPREDAPVWSEEAREARDAWLPLVALHDLTRAGLAWRVTGSLPDPAVLSPALDAAARLTRALRGRERGPYR